MLKDVHFLAPRRWKSSIFRWQHLFKNFYFRRKFFFDKIGIRGDWWKTGTKLASLQFWRTRKVEPDGGPLDDEGKPQRSLTWIILQDRVCSSSSWNSIVAKMPKIFNQKTKVQIVFFCRTCIFLQKFSIFFWRKLFLIIIFVIIQQKFKSFRFS